MSIIARAPLRLSFGGGGTDLPAYYEEHGGLVVSTAITRYAMVIASESPDRSIDVNSCDYRTSLHWPASEAVPMGEPLSLPRAALGWFQERGLLDRGVQLVLSSEAAPGSGLGSSSAMAVALVAALGARTGLELSREAIAAIARELEIERLERPIGCQDQYASAVGGLNTIAFAVGDIRVAALALPPGVSEKLAAHLLLFSTGATRDSASILAGQRQRTADGSATSGLHALKEIAREMQTALETGALDRFGALLDAGWQIKRGLAAGVSLASIDRVYALARAHGALGGKIAGAGGGGHLLLFAPPEVQAQLITMMEDEGLRRVTFGFNESGVTVDRLPVRQSEPALTR